jgi:ArsR family transcriptional regulator
MRIHESSTSDPNFLKALKALASPVRLRILHLLKDPVATFPPQVDGDLVKDGACADFIREAIGLAPATASRHLTLLAEAGMLVATRKRGWTFYRRNEQAIRQLTQQLRSEL